MGPDAANLAGSLAKSLDVDRSPNSSQRASEMAQQAASAPFADSINPSKTEQAEKIRQAKIQKERERRRREAERQMSHKDSNNEQEPEDNKLDVMV